MSAAPIHPGEIAIIMATRGRPEMLVQVFASLKANTRRKENVSVWIYVDADDDLTRQAIDCGTLGDAGLPVHWHFGPQTPGLCETQHELWRQSGQTAELYVISVDDARFDTPGWDDVARSAATKYPDGLFLAAPFDPATADTSTYPIFGWRWLQTLGQIFPGHFPYWFDDRWVHQIGVMAGRYEPLPIVMFPIRGKGRTRRMRDLPFWTRFFQLMLVERKNSAQTLIEAMNHEPQKKSEALKQLDAQAAKFAKEQDKFSDLYAVFQEERFTLHPPEERRGFNAGYFQKEAQAVGRLLEEAQKLMAAGQPAEAMKYLDGTLMSNLRVQQAQDMKVACLRALGKNSTADQLEKETIASWPRMNFARRLFRFLGMVASDGKTMLIGFFQGGKKK